MLSLETGFVLIKINGPQIQYKLYVFLFLKKLTMSGIFSALPQIDRVLLISFLVNNLDLHILLLGSVFHALHFLYDFIELFVN